ncbi:hypothetical protein ACSTS3_22705 [Aquimarina muelleri]|uniref:hypothetical protein n=1 Tax=Aquimarina muelleri TaxID=279356 RepID=UPI003F686E0D
MRSTKLLLFVILLWSLNAISQNCSIGTWLENYKDELGQELKDSDSIIYESDFSNILLDHKTKYIGFIGKNKKRLHISFESIKKNNNQYHVLGSTTVGRNTRRFEGYIKIKEICSFKNFIYGVDDWMKGKVKDQGFLVGEFSFSENPKHSATGVFKGKLLARWYLDLESNLNYDNIDSDSDSYSNNQFLGTWTSYKTNKVSQCAWGHYKIPCAGDLNIGAAEFSPNKKYFDFGWRDYSNK